MINLIAISCSLLMTVPPVTQAGPHESIEYVRQCAPGVELQITVRRLKFRPRSARDQEQLQKLFAPLGWELEQNGPVPEARRVTAWLVTSRHGAREVLWVRDLIGPVPGFNRGPFEILDAVWQDGILVVIYHNGHGIIGEVVSPAVVRYDVLTEPPDEIALAGDHRPRNLLVDATDVPHGSKWSASFKGQIAENSLRVTLACAERKRYADLRRSKEGLFWWRIERDVGNR